MDLCGGNKGVGSQNAINSIPERDILSRNTLSEAQKRTILPPAFYQHFTPVHSAGIVPNIIHDWILRSLRKS